MSRSPSTKVGTDEDLQEGGGGCKCTNKNSDGNVTEQVMPPPHNSLSDRLVLPTLVFSQFACTCLWFAPNAVISQVDNFEESQVSALVSCVQAGFVVGTLVLTYLTLTDRVSPPLLFAGMALAGSALNALCIATTSFAAWAILRVLIGVCLAGVYPVGMKIAATQYPSGLGARLGILVGALTLGTAFPWLVRGIGDEAGLPFGVTLGTVSFLAVAGAIIMVLVMVPRMGGPGSQTLHSVFSCCFTTKESEKLVEIIGVAAELDGAESDNDGEEIAIIGRKAVELTPDGASKPVTNGTDQTDPVDDDDAAAEITTDRRHSDSLPPRLSGMSALKAILVASEFRAAAIGYFGHMWELYGFLTHVPSLINSHMLEHGGVILGNEALTSFATIGIGAISCSVAGIWSLHAGRGIYPGSAVVAIVSLATSLLCCLIVPAYQRMNQGIFLFFLLVWGSAVVADSAQFSSLAAAYAYPGLVGTALTLTTSIGFAITIVSIQMVGALIDSGWDPGYAMALLAIGPATGVYRAYVEWPLHHLLRRATAAHQVKPKTENLENDIRKIQSPEQLDISCDKFRIVAE
jgi:MFS family permease